MAHRLSPEAEADLDEIWYYVASSASIEIADRLVDSLTTRFFLLGRYPREPAGAETIFDTDYVPFRSATTSFCTDSTAKMH